MKKLLVLLFIFTSFLATAQAQEKQKKTEITITDLNGKNYTVKGTPEGLDVAEAKGKVLFVEFFGHNCPPCLMTIPHFRNLYAKHKDKIEILAFEIDSQDPLTEQQLKAFAQRKQINYPIFYTPKNRLFVSYLAQRAQWNGSIPFLVALNSKGEVRYIQAGLIPEDVLEKMFLELSAK